MLKTIEAVIDAQGKVHWQEQPPIQGDCHVLITILDDFTLSKSNKALTLMQRWQNFRENLPNDWEDIDFSSFRDRSEGRDVKL